MPVIVPKLKKKAFNLPLKNFLRLIQKYPQEIRNALLKRYKAVTEMSKARESERGEYQKGGKLSEYQKIYVVEMASRLYRASQIMEVIRDEWGIKYSNVSLNKLLRRNAQTIHQKRLRYTADLETLRFVHERPRIEEFTEIFEEAKKEIFFCSF